MNVRMLTTVRGKPDGIKQTFVYEEGQAYSPDSSPPMTPGLARVLLDGGLAEALEAESDVVEHKVVQPNQEQAVTKPIEREPEAPTPKRRAHRKQ